MPPRPAGQTKHTRRMDSVRPRLVEVLRSIKGALDTGHLPSASNRNGKLSPHGIFARTCVEIAKRDNRQWFRKGSEVVTAKDSSTSIRRFAEGTQAISFERMDVIELACIQWEGFFREQKLSRAQDGNTFSGERPSEAAMRLADEEEQGKVIDATASAPGGHLSVVPTLDDHEERHTPPSAGEGQTEPGYDAEIDAIWQIKQILDPLNENQVKRVVAYLMDRRELSL